MDQKKKSWLKQKKMMKIILIVLFLFNICTMYSLPVNNIERLVKDVSQGKRNPVHDLTKKKSKNKSFIYIHYIFYCIEIKLIN